MKKRYIYSILFGIPGLILSVDISLIASGVAAGFLWIFYFGDNPWPSGYEKVFLTLLALVFLTVWLASVIIGFVVGKRLEKNPIFNKKHILISTGLTLLLVLYLVLSRLSLGLIGSTSDSTRCSDYCTQKGYSASSMPPRDSGVRTCSCLDNSGLEVIKVPMDFIELPK